MRNQGSGWRVELLQAPCLRCLNHHVFGVGRVHLGLGARGLGCGVQIGFEVWGLGFRVQGSIFLDSDVRLCMLEHVGCKMCGALGVREMSLSEVRGCGVSEERP